MSGRVFTVTSAQNIQIKKNSNNFEKRGLNFEGGRTAKYKSTALSWYHFEQ